MSDELWQNMIINFLNAKRDDKLVVLYKESIKKASQLYSKDKEASKFLKDFFQESVLKKTKEMSEIEFYTAQFNKLKEMCEQELNIPFHLIEEYYNLLNPINKKTGNLKVLEAKLEYEPNTWLSYAASNIQKVGFATHVAKLTQSSIKTNRPAIVDVISDTNYRYLTTSTFERPIIDGAYTDAKYSPIMQFWSLNLGDKVLADEFKQIENKILKPFSSNTEQLEKWNMMFASAHTLSGLSTHSLAKQVYFPIQDNHSYHLLVQMVSSSMAHAIFGLMYTDSAKATRDQYYNKRFSDDLFINFPEKAALSVTASNHSNASQLNGKRGGKLYLFNAQPPTWTAQKNPPRKKSYFYEPQLAYRSSEAVREMSEMLVTFEKAAISYREPRRLRGILNWCRDIASDAIHFASQIQQLPAGWSADPSLKLDEAHQLFLDSNRQDSDFKQKRQSSDWQKEITKDFAKWLNAALKKASKDQFTPQLEHSKLWQAVFAEELRIYLDVCKGYEINQVQDAGGAV